MILDTTTVITTIIIIYNSYIQVSLVNETSSLWDYL